MKPTHIFVSHFFSIFLDIPPCLPPPLRCVCCPHFRCVSPQYFPAIYFYLKSTFSPTKNVLGAPGKLYPDKSASGANLGVGGKVGGGVEWDILIRSWVGFWVGFGKGQRLGLGIPQTNIQNDKKLQSEPGDVY